MSDVDEDDLVKALRFAAVVRAVLPVDPAVDALAAKLMRRTQGPLVGRKLKRKGEP